MDSKVAYEHTHARTTRPIRRSHPVDHALLRVNITHTHTHRERERERESDSWPRRRRDLRRGLCHPRLARFRRRLGKFLLVMRGRSNVVYHSAVGHVMWSSPAVAISSEGLKRFCAVPTESKTLQNRQCVCKNIAITKKRLYVSSTTSFLEA